MIVLDHVNKENKFIHVYYTSSVVDNHIYSQNTP